MCQYHARDLFVAQVDSAGPRGTHLELRDKPLPGGFRQVRFTRQIIKYMHQFQRVTKQLLLAQCWQALQQRGQLQN